jgi:sugar phosphate permease
MIPIGSSIPGSDKRLYRRVGWWLLPFLLLCYLFAMIDRLNVGFAKLQFLADLHFDEAVFGMAAGILYVGYILFEIPSNLLLDRSGIRLTLLRIMTLWGVLTMAIAFARSEMAFYVLRFLIGVAEAGFFPGVVLYLTYWFPDRFRGRTISLFAMAVPISGIVAGPVSGWIMTHLHDTAGLRGWQWLFLLEGLPSILLGAVAYFFLVDRPDKARFLSETEKKRIETDLQADAFVKAGAAPRSFGEALRRPRVYGLALVYFAFYSMQSVLLIWVPTLLKNAGMTDIGDIGWRAGLISLAGAVGMVVICYSSDRLGERRWHLIGCGSVASLLFMLLPLGASSPDVTTLLLALSAIVIFAFLGLFWTVPTALLGSRATAGGIALISSIGASGSAFSPAFIGWMKVLTGSFYGAVSSLALLLLISMTLLYWCMSSRDGERRSTNEVFTVAGPGTGD